MPRAEAQGVRATLAPISSFYGAPYLTGHRFGYCAAYYGPSTPPNPPPFPIPGEWEVLIENDTDTQQTVAFDINARTGLRGNYFSLNCPPLQVPAGVDPVADVTCSESSHQLQVRNITIEPCERVRLRFSVDPVRNETATPYMVDACMGGTVSGGTFSLATQSPFSDQIPDEGGDTCVFFGTADCSAPISFNLAQRYYAIDENGPPLLPGDTLLFHAQIDMRYVGDLLPPGTNMFLALWDGNTDTSDTAIALPQFLDFVEFVDKPLEGLGALYAYNNGTRMVTITDPGCPSGCTVQLAMGTSDYTHFVTWRGRLNCAAPNLTQICHYPRARLRSSFGSESSFGADNWYSYTSENDSTCVGATLPDISGSSKRIEDTDRSGDAQPGELLTFFVDVNNATVCPAENMTCECRATNVVVTDTVDTTFLDPASINPLDGGVLTPPNQIRWTIPAVQPSGVFGSTQTVRFQARVITSARNNDDICNTASINAAELTASSDGGLTNCSTKPPVSVSVTPCMTVRIPPGPSLALDKTVAPTLSCYPVGSTVTYSITVTNVGQGQATQVVVRDVLNAQFCPGGICNVTNISDAGSIVGQTITWPPIATLAGGGATRTYTFDLTIPKNIPDGTVVPNTATTSSTEITTAVPSNVRNLSVCAPVLNFTKTADKTVYSETETATWTLSLRNDGSTPATTVIVSDTIDTARIDPLTLVFTPSTGTLVGSTYTWPALASLAGGGAQTVDYTIAGNVRTGTAGQQVCNTGRVTWDQGDAQLSSTPTSGTCSDIIRGGGGCTVGNLGSIGPVKGVKTSGNAVFSWPALGAPPTEYHLNSVTTKTDVPPAASCPATTGSKRSSCGTGAARDSQTTPNGTHTGAIADPARLLFYQVYAACGSTGDLEGPF